MWFLKTAFFAILAFSFVSGLAAGGLVLVSAVVAVRWDDALPVDDAPMGIWLLWILACTIAALFTHGGVIAAGLVILAAAAALVLPRWERATLPPAPDRTTEPEAPASD